VQLSPLYHLEEDIAEDSRNIYFCMVKSGLLYAYTPMHMRHIVIL